VIEIYDILVVTSSISSKSSCGENLRKVSNGVLLFENVAEALVAIVETEKNFCRVEIFGRSIYLTKQM
jgi:hypothetical protein